VSKLYQHIGVISEADGGCDVAMMATSRSAWQKFREHLLILTGK